MSKQTVKVMIGVDPCIPTVQELTNEFPEVEFGVGDTPESQLAQIQPAEICIGSLTREAFLAARKLKWVQSAWTGIDFAIAIPELVESDVVVTNIADLHAPSMADHVFAMILAFAHCLPQVLDDQKHHRWDTNKYHNKILELSGTTIGILGFGAVGRAIARRAQGFNMNIYAIARVPKAAPEEAHEVWPPQRLDDLLKISDWFVIAAPLTDQTRGLINKRRIGLLKPNAHVIVISRGAIINEGALADALREKRIAGAATDSLAQEPPDPDNLGPLWDLDNCLITPHSSGPTAEMFAARQRFCKENLRRYLDGKPLENVCDKRAGY